MSKNNTPPSHRVYAVTKVGKQSYWRAIGAIWPHGDGDGFSVQLDYLPLNGAEIVIRKPKAKAEEVEAEQAVVVEADTAAGETA